MTALGNVLWMFIGGGIISGMLWMLLGLLMFVSIIGIPFGKACFMIGRMAFLPFGHEVVSRKDLTLKDDVGTSKWGLLGNIIWFVFFGLPVALVHVLFAIYLALSIIGIPFAWCHLKLAHAALFPIGKTVVPCEVADLVKKEKQSQVSLEKYRAL